MKNKFIAFIMLLVFALPAYAGDIPALKLPEPRTQGGKVLMQCLKERKTGREFSSRELPAQLFADLLWAANGINRPDSGQRTAPTAHDSREIDIYLAKKDGLYLYDAKNNQLLLVSSADIRGVTGEQDFVKTAPVNLIFVADFSKLGSFSGPDKELYAATDTGFISQNIYLFAASEGLSTVVRGWMNKPALAKAMGLRKTQRIILAQTVGYPEK